jgi:hypothetical protein
VVPDDPDQEYLRSLATQTMKWKETQITKQQQNFIKIKVRYTAREQWS